MLCRCHCHLEAPDEESLIDEILAHLSEFHPVVEHDETRIREVISSHSYHYECVAVYADDAGPDEEFGPEPY